MNVFLPIRARASLLAPLCALPLLLTVSACSTTTTVNNTPVVITQHAQSLTLAPGQRAAKTVRCDTTAGEVLISGGYAAADLSLKSAIAANNPTLTGEQYLILGNYPSDATGAPPSAQGQAEPGWTVRATNPLATPITLSIYADCLTGGGVSTLTTSNTTFTDCKPLLASLDRPASAMRTLGATARGGVRGLPTAPSSGCGKDWEIGCPTAARALTGGGWSADNFISSSYPIENHGINDQRWVAHAPPGVSATVYAVCAKNLYNVPLATLGVTAPAASGTSCHPAGCGYVRTAVGSVSCPTDALLVGGGFEKVLPLAEALTSTMGQPSLGSWTSRYSIVDTTGYYNNTSLTMTIYGVCVTPKPPNSAFITFSNYHHLLRIPADTVVAATDGSGQINAIQRTARVHQIASAPIAAPAVSNPFTGGRIYQVPNGCGDSAPAVTAAKSALVGLLRQQTPAGETVFSGPTVDIAQDSLTCTPVAGTRNINPFTYVQHIDGSASQASFNPADVRSYQTQQLQATVQRLGAGYVLTSSTVCPGALPLSAASPTRVSITCPASGTADYQWTTARLQQLATQLAGKTLDQARALLESTPGVQPGSAVIVIPPDSRQQRVNGTIVIAPGTLLPEDPSLIQLILVVDQAS